MKSHGISFGCDRYSFRTDNFETKFSAKHHILILGHPLYMMSTVYVPHKLVDVDLTGVFNLEHKLAKLLTA